MTIKSFVIPVVLLLASVQVALAQSSNSSPTQTPVPVDELATLSQQWMDAMQQNDMPTLERLMAPEFTLVHPSVDKVLTRAQWLSNLTGVEVKRFRYQTLKIVHYGPTVAVVSSILRIDTVKDGAPFAAKTSCVDVWEKRAGKWQVVTRYATRLEDIPLPQAAPTAAAPQEALAKPNSSPAQRPGPVDELATLSQQWMEAALKHHDMPTLERLMAPEFTLVHPSVDTVGTRAQWLSNLTGVEVTQFSYKHLKVIHYGSTLAVVSSIFFSDAVKNGVSFGGGGAKTSCIDVWEKRAGKWQVVTRYATRPQEITIRPPAPKPPADTKPPAAPK